MKPIFIISLDFELHWGGFDKWPLNDYYKKYFAHTRESIPTVLALFAKAGLHATWATVGLLMHRDRSALVKNIPVLQPTYATNNLSAYNYISLKGIGENETDDPYHFAASLLEKILCTEGQEVGTHTFAHFYCNESGQTVEQFQADLAAAKNAAAQLGVNLKSLVFPRNQFNSQYLSVCARSGLKIVRINPIDWWWKIESTQDESVWKRLIRGLDAYFSIGGKNSFPLMEVKTEEKVILLPASRLLRPYRPKEFLLNNLKISKIKKEMLRAARAGEVYHLWWHPHNFGNYTAQNLQGLAEIANHFQKLRKKYGMVSLNMGEVANLLGDAG